MPDHLRQLWLAIILLASAFIGTAGGVLVWLDEHRLPDAILAGATTFAGTVAFLFVVYSFLAGPPSQPR
jgi:hypothetical protein